MATQLLYLMYMIISKQLIKDKTPKILCVVVATLSQKLPFSVLDISSGESQPFQSQDGLLGLQKTFLWLSLALLSHRTYLWKVCLTAEVALKSFTRGLCTKRTLNGCQNACKIERLNAREPFHQDSVSQTCLEFPSSEVWMLGCSKLTPPLHAFWHPHD